LPATEGHARVWGWRLALVVTVAVALHARAGWFGFSYLDDDVLIIDQQRTLNAPGSIWRAFRQTYLPATGRDHAYYRPLASASFALDARYSRSGRGYHVANILLHGLAAGLLFLLLRRLGHRDGVALLGGLLFAVHPALTEAVVWIPGRNDLLLVAATLAAWLALLRALAPGSGKRWGARLAHPLLWLAALASKESAIVLPLVWLAHAHWIARRPWRDILRPWLLVGWSAALVIYLLARTAVVPSGLGAAGLSFGHVVGNLRLIPTSLGKLLLAHPLAVLATPQDTPLWPGLIALRLVAALFFLPGVRRARLAFALGAFVAFLAPSLPASNLLILESRLYLPAIAFVLLVAEVAESWQRPPRGAATATGLALAGLAAVAFAYGAHFRDRMTFGQAAVRGSPRSSLAHRNLGVTYHLAGDVEAARRAYREALAQDPNEPIAHNNLGVIYMAERQLALAERELRAEIAVNPDYAIAHRNLALVLHALGREGEARLESHQAAALSR
jgi:tetratricopeptide (TPR) repeat protein